MHVQPPSQSFVTGTGARRSQENYAHLGLQCEYLRLKSIQRFTETWVALEHAWNVSLLHLRDAQASQGC